MRIATWQILLFALFSAACTAGAGGGLAGGVIAALVTGAALLVACSGGVDKKDGTNNDETNVSACLSYMDPDFGPCLSPPPPDMGIADDAGMDDVSGEPDFGPCLTPLPPDMGSDAGPGDVGTDAGDNSDAGDMSGIGAAPSDKNQLLAKLRDRLPADVVDRLDGSDDEKV